VRFFLIFSDLPDAEERMLILHQEMGDLRHQEFETTTHLDILTTAEQTAVDVAPSGPALLASHLRVLPDRVREAMCVGVHQGVANALVAA
jgi:hypothetical protein